MENKPYLGFCGASITISSQQTHKKGFEVHDECMVFMITQSCVILEIRDEIHTKNQTYVCLM